MAFDGDLRNSCDLVVKMFRLKVGIELCHLFKGVAHELGDFVQAHPGRGKISSEGMPKRVKRACRAQPGFLVRTS